MNFLNRRSAGIYSLIYQFVRGKAKLKRNKELPDPIGHVRLKDGTQAPAHPTIPQLNGGKALTPNIEVIEFSKELGFFFNPVGNDMHHQIEIKGKGLTCVDNIHTCPLLTRDAWQSFFLTIILGMTWGLVAVNMAPE